MHDNERLWLHMDVSNKPGLYSKMVIWKLQKLVSGPWDNIIIIVSKPELLAKGNLRALLVALTIIFFFFKCFFSSFVLFVIQKSSAHGSSSGFIYQSFESFWYCTVCTLCRIMRIKGLVKEITQHLILGVIDDLLTHNTLACTVAVLVIHQSM